MIDPAVELELHPWPDIATRQQLDGALDEIVEIKKSPGAFQPLILADDSIRNHRHRACNLDLPQERELVTGIEQEIGRFLIALENVRQSGTQRLGEGFLAVELAFSR